MKKSILIIPFILLALSCFGQEVASVENAQSSIVRKCDRYTVDGQTYYNSTAFRGYLKNTNPDLFAQYNQGYKLGMAGWGLMSYGIAMAPTSMIMLFMNMPYVIEDPVTEEIIKKGHPYPVEAWYGGWMFSLVVACASFTASIPMLGIGYHKMHKAVDVYNISQTTTAPQTYWSIRTSSNGIGIAYNF